MPAPVENKVLQYPLVQKQPVRTTDLSAASLSATARARGLHRREYRVTLLGRARKDCWRLRPHPIYCMSGPLRGPWGIGCKLVAI
jgi:hypothetical protein